MWSSSCSGLRISPALVLMYSIPLKKICPINDSPLLTGKKKFFLDDIQTEGHDPNIAYFSRGGHLLPFPDPALVPLDSFLPSIMFSFSVSGKVRTCVPNHWVPLSTIARLSILLLCVYCFTFQEHLVIPTT